MEQTKQTGFHSSFKSYKKLCWYSGYWLPNNMTNHGVISNIGPVEKKRYYGPITSQEI